MDETCLKCPSNNMNRISSAAYWLRLFPLQSQKPCAICAPFSWTTNNNGNLSKWSLKLFFRWIPLIRWCALFHSFFLFIGLLSHIDVLPICWPLRFSLLPLSSHSITAKLIYTWEKCSNTFSDQPTNHPSAILIYCPLGNQNIFQKSKYWILAQDLWWDCTQWIAIWWLSWGQIWNINRLSITGIIMCHPYPDIQAET